MEEITGERSVPRVFIGGEFFGGRTEIDAAERDGRLEVGILRRDLPCQLLLTIRES